MAKKENLVGFAVKVGNSYVSKAGEVGWVDSATVSWSTGKMQMFTPGTIGYKSANSLAAQLDGEVVGVYTRKLKAEDVPHEED